MRALVVADRELQIEERPDPVPQPGEVLVRVLAAGLNRADLAQRAGFYPAPPGVPPVGEASWSDTRLVLPASLPQRAYRDTLTGSIVELDRGPSGPGLRLSQAFGYLPVAILEPS